MPQPLALEILLEDNHLIVVNKQWGALVQGDRSRDPTLADRVREYLRREYGKPGRVFLGTIHRIDRPTSGVVLFAKTSKALSRMNAAFREGQVEKRYWAVVDAMPPSESGELVHYLRKDQRRNKSYVSDEAAPGARKATLSYRLLASSDRYHLLEVEIGTGRHHQIRSQLWAIGCHVKGDLKYGAARSNPEGGIHLHARSLAFDHPVREERVEVVAPPPDDPLWQAFEAMLGG
jgi:23S rRNA pseudouridine1911/1915/1917 synthase